VREGSPRVKILSVLAGWPGLLVPEFFSSIFPSLIDVCGEGWFFVLDGDGTLHRHQAVSADPTPFRGSFIALT